MKISSGAVLVAAFHYAGNEDGDLPGKSRALVVAAASGGLREGKHDDNATGRTTAGDSERRAGRGNVAPSWQRPRSRGHGSLRHSGGDRIRRIGHRPTHARQAPQKTPRS